MPALCVGGNEMEFMEVATLEKFVSKVDSYLKDSKNQKLVTYPKESINPWNESQIDEKNDDLLSSLSGVANIYAIFVLRKGANLPDLKYIGKTTKKLARQRLRNHLITKHALTGAKLADIKNEVKNGNQIKISFVSIEPESLRNYVEEELINNNRNSSWNRENA